MTGRKERADFEADFFDIQAAHLAALSRLAEAASRYAVALDGDHDRAAPRLDLLDACVAYHAALERLAAYSCAA